MKLNLKNEVIYLNIINNVIEFNEWSYKFKNYKVI